MGATASMYDHTDGQLMGYGTYPLSKSKNRILSNHEKRIKEQSNKDLSFSQPTLNKEYNNNNNNIKNEKIIKKE